jgi:hypothetical protein
MEIMIYFRWLLKKYNDTQHSTAVNAAAKFILVRWRRHCGSAGRYHTF